MDEQAKGPEQTSATPTQGTPLDPKQKNVLFGVMSYLSILVVVAYMMGKDDPFVLFHVRQGAVLFVIEIAAMVLGSMAYYGLGYMVISLVNIATLVFSIIGIVNVVQNKQQELPFIGAFAKHIPL